MVFQSLESDVQCSRNCSACSAFSSNGFVPRRVSSNPRITMKIFECLSEQIRRRVCYILFAEEPEARYHSQSLLSNKGCSFKGENSSSVRSSSMPSSLSHSGASAVAMYKACASDRPKDLTLMAGSDVPSNLAAACLVRQVKKISQLVLGGRSSIKCRLSKPRCLVSLPLPRNAEPASESSRSDIGCLERFHFLGLESQRHESSYNSSIYTY